MHNFSHVLVNLCRWVKCYYRCSVVSCVGISLYFVAIVVST